MTDEGFAVVNKVTMVTVAGGSGGAFLLGMSSQEIAAWAGIAIAFIAAVGNLAINWYWRRKTYQLKKRQFGEGPTNPGALT